MKSLITKSIATVLLISIASPIFSQIKFRKKIGGNSYDYGMSAIQIDHKGYIVCGSSSSYGFGNSDVFVVKTDSMGLPGIHNSFGGINIDRGNCIRKTTDSGYIFTGYSNSFGNGGYDVYLVKIDSNLNEQWARALGGNDWDFGNCVEQTADGGYIICGSTYSFGMGDQDYYLVKTDNNGDTVWTKTFGGTGEDIARSVIQTSDGGYLVTGHTTSFGDVNGDFYTVKTDMNGDTLWTNKIGGTQADIAYDVVESSAGYYIVCGETKSIGAGNSDGVIYKISLSGITGSNYTFGGSSFDNFQSITERPDGAIAMCGKTTSFGFANGNGEVLIVALHQDWSFLNATTFGGYEKENGFSVETTQDNGFIVCGQTNDTYNTLEDIYLIKTDSMANSTTSDVNAPTGIVESAANKSISIFPNPANSHFTIELNELEGEHFIIVSSILGEQMIEVRTNCTKNSIFQIECNTLNNGIYLLNIYNSKKQLVGTQKLVIQHQ